MPTTRNAFVLIQAMAFAALLAGCGGAGDPSTAQSHSACGPYDVTWNQTSGRIYHPRGADCSASVYGPLVVIFHAAGNTPTYQYDDYDYLQQHLARNGIASVSVDVLAASNITDADEHHSAAAQQAWDFVVGYMWTEWDKRFYVDPDSFGVIGHSRGGRTARYLARLLEDSPLFRVRSVVGLAPASGNDVLAGQHTIGYLLLYGSVDQDTSPRSSFGQYDQAGSDDSQRDPAVDADVLYKAVKFVHGGGHPGYSDLGSEAQQNLTKGYVLAFLKAHNADDVTWYEDYVRGDAVPGEWSDDVFTQYSDGFYRRVVDHFDDGEVANATLGGNLTTFNATAQVLDLGSMASTYVHLTHALWTWGAPDGAAVTWSIPEGRRDASGFEWLSLRIGQASGDPANDLRIQIRNGGAWSPEVRLTDHGSIAQPTDMCFNQPPPPCQPRTYMATIRVPLTAFGGHDNVDFVRIRFRGDATVDTFIVDNLEFSEWVFKP